MLILLIQNHLMKKKSHITWSKNESLKYFCDVTSKTTVFFVNIVHFGWSIWLSKLEVGDPSRDIMSLSEINSTGVFNLEPLWHFLLSISTMLKNYCMYADTVHIFLSPFPLMWHIYWLIKGFFDTILWSNPSNSEESFWTLVFILVNPKKISPLTIFFHQLTFYKKSVGWLAV